MGDPDSGRWGRRDRRAPWRADGGASHHHANAPTSDGSGGLIRRLTGQVDSRPRARRRSRQRGAPGAGLFGARHRSIGSRQPAPGGDARLCGRRQRRDRARALVDRGGRAGRPYCLGLRRAGRTRRAAVLAGRDRRARGAGGIVQRVDPAPSFRGEAVVENLLDNLDSLEEPAALVIDDLHELRSSEALRWLEVFLAALPSKLRVVLVTREDPRARPASPAACRQADRAPRRRPAFTPEEAEALLRGSNVGLSRTAA